MSPGTDAALWAGFDHPIPVLRPPPHLPPFLKRSYFFPECLLIFLRMKATGLQGGKGRLSVHDRK